MLSNVLIVVAAAVFSVALRTYRHTMVRRVGTLGIFATSFLAGWLIGGHLALGFLFAATWLALPWFEILTRVRTLRIPVDRRLEEWAPPPTSEFPDFPDLTDEIERGGFEQVDDVGWEHDGQRQFFRLFYHAPSATEAAICMVEQSDVTFYYVSITSREESGRVFMTWNYPFSYGLTLSPKFKIQRVAGGTPFDGMLAEHRLFLDENRIGLDTPEAQTPESIRIAIEQDMRDQIAHNIACGVLKHDGPDTIRYSVRGMVFLWFQFLRDLVRLS